MTNELPMTATRGVYLVYLCAYGTTTDDETDVYTNCEIGVAGEVDGDGSALVALAGSIAHDPEQVDARAGETGVTITGIQVVSCGGQGDI